MKKNQKPIKRVTTEFVNPAEDEDDKRPMEYFDPAEESFSQFRSKFGTEGVLVKIYRRTPRGVQFCFQGEPSEIDEEVVRLYHAKQPYASEEGQYLLRCFVNGEGRDGFPVLIAPQVATPGTVGAPSGGMASQDVMTRILERLEARIDRMSEHEREPLSSLADAMLKLQQLQPKPAELPIDTLMKAVELGKTIAAPADGGGTLGEWGPIIKEALTHAGPVLGAMLQGLTARRAGALADGGGSMQTGQGEDMMLRQAFGFLKRKCLAGSDPGLYIDIILDNRDEDTYQKLIHAVLTREFSAFAAIDPEIQQAPYLAFFKFIYDGLRSAADESNQVAKDTGGEGGNKGNAASDGEPRKASGKKS